MSLSLHQTDERRDLGIISLFGAQRGGNGGLESSLVTPTSERTPPTIGEGKSLQKKDLHVYLNWEVPLPADIEDIAQVVRGSGIERKNVDNKRDQRPKNKTVLRSTLHAVYLCAVLLLK